MVGGGRVSHLHNAGCALVIRAPLFHALVSSKVHPTPEKNSMDAWPPGNNVVMEEVCDGGHQLHVGICGKHVSFAGSQYMQSLYGSHVPNAWSLQRDTCSSTSAGCSCGESEGVGVAVGDSCPKQRPVSRGSTSSRVRGRGEDARVPAMVRRTKALVPDRARAARQPDATRARAKTVENQPRGKLCEAADVCARVTPSSARCFNCQLGVTKFARRAVKSQKNG